MNGATPLPAFERTVSRLMLVGLWLSSGCLAVGLAFLLALGPSSEGSLLLRAGLLILMATPVLRVVLSVAEALRLRDWFWLWSTAAVVVVLTGTVLYSLRTSG